MLPNKQLVRRPGQRAMFPGASLAGAAQQRVIHRYSTWISSAIV